MIMSGLPDIVNSVTEMCTFEGDNVVLWQQVALYLMKGLDTEKLLARIFSLLDTDMKYTC